MEKKKTFLINVAYYGFFIILFLLAWKYVWPVLMPFILAFIIVTFLRKPAEKLAKKIRLGEKYTALLLLTGFYLLFFGAVILGGGKVITMIADFITDLPGFYQTSIAPLLEHVSQQIGDALAEMDMTLAQEIQRSMQQFVQNIGETLSTLSMNALAYISGLVTGIPAALIRLIIMIVSSFYMAADYHRIMAMARTYLPEKVKQLGRDVKIYGWNILKAYIKSYTLLFLLTFAELTVGLTILKIPYAFAIGLAIAVFDILPVLGTGGVLLPWAVILLVLGDYPLALGILTLYVVITIVRNSLEPRIVGKQVGLHPLLTLIAMFLGLELGGIIGMILLPLSVVILVNMEKNGALHGFKKTH